MTGARVAPCPGSEAGHATARCLAATLAILPLMLLLPMDWDRSLPLALIPTLLLAARLKPPAQQNRPITLLWTWAALAATGSALLSDHTARSITTTSAWALTIAGGFVAARLDDSSGSLKTVLRGLACGGVVGLLACRALLDADASILPLYGHPRILGMHMLSAAIAALALLTLDRSPGKLVRSGYWVLASILCGGLWWAGGRAPVLGMLVALAHWSIISGPADRRWLWSRLPLLGVLAGAWAWSAGSTFHGMGWLSPFERTVAAASLNELTSTRSDDIWQTARYISDSPWIGHGADSYLFIRPRQIGDQPHNVLIQWLLDFGLFGTIPLVVISLHVMASGTRAPDIWRKFAAGGICGCVVVGLFDGIFYHAILFIPVAVMAGLAAALQRGGESAPTIHRSRRWFAALTRTALALAAGCLLLHGWLHRQLATALPKNPQALSARVLAVFPSQTYPLVRWLEHWSKTDPATALAWSQWATPRSISADHFHLFNARLFNRHGKADLAITELEAARAACRPEQRHFYNELIGLLNAPVSASGKPSAPPDDAVKESAKTNPIPD